MANTELAIRFTETMYATKNDVSKELKMSLIDNIWANILNYRSYFNHYLTIKSIERSQFSICVCPTIQTKITDLEAKLIKALRESMRIYKNPNSAKEIENKYARDILLMISQAEKLDENESYIRSLLNGDIKEISENNKLLLNYNAALDFIRNNYQNPIDDSYLANLYSKITGNDELTSFYRTTEEYDAEKNVLINRIYTAAPAKYIEEMMNGLFAFVANSTLSDPVKALVAYYYINYIQPFPRYNGEVAVLFAKSVLAHNLLSEIGAYLPLETLLVENAENTSKMFLEVQKTNDVTYFVNEGLGMLLEACQKLLDNFVKVDVDDLKNDFYKPETPIIKKEEPKTEKTYISPQPTKRVVEVNEENVELAINSLPAALDEKQAARLTEHLLELDPSLKKGEAHFYARHCTLGKKYTIQQFKKAEGCAYETARTSMEHLAELGYYKKEQLKNKFVYAPVRRD